MSGNDDFNPGGDAVETPDYPPYDKRGNVAQGRITVDPRAPLSVGGATERGVLVDVQVDMASVVVYKPDSPEGRGTVVFFWHDDEQDIMLRLDLDASTYGEVVKSV